MNCRWGGEHDIKSPRILARIDSCPKEEQCPWKWRSQKIDAWFSNKSTATNYSQVQQAALSFLVFENNNNVLLSLSSHSTFYPLSHLMIPATSSACSQQEPAIITSCAVKKKQGFCLWQEEIPIFMRNWYGTC